MKVTIPLGYEAVRFRYSATPESHQKRTGALALCFGDAAAVAPKKQSISAFAARAIARPADATGIVAGLGHIVYLELLIAHVQAHCKWRVCGADGWRSKGRTRIPARSCTCELPLRPTLLGTLFWSLEVGHRDLTSKGPPPMPPFLRPASRIGGRSAAAATFRSLASSGQRRFKLLVSRGAQVPT